MRSPGTDRNFLLATRSAHKVREIAAILRARSIRVLSLDEIGLPLSQTEDDIEAFDSFFANARAKAKHFHGVTGMPTLADDSGLCVHALDGRPGVRSRRWSGRDDLDGAALDAANNQALLDALAGMPLEGRAAHYACAAVLIGPDGAVTVGLGSVTGRILDAPRGAGGFGYDPLFLVPALGLTFAECDSALKHAWSHRGRAFRAVAHALAHAG